jgi:hypothetical protein
MKNTKDKKWEFTGYKEPQFWFGDRVYLLDSLSYKNVPGTIIGMEWHDEIYSELPGFWYSVWFTNCVSTVKIFENCLTKN